MKNSYFVNEMNRRALLKGLFASSVLGPLGVMLRRPVFAANPDNGKTVVIIFQRGANDGLNTIVPFGDSQYYSARDVINIPSPASGGANKAIDIDGYFGWNPNIGSHTYATDDGNAGTPETVGLLKEIYDTPKSVGGSNYPSLAVFTAVGRTGSSQSHFTDQDKIELSNTLDNTNLGGSGWLNRFLQTAPQFNASKLQAAAMASGVDKSLRPGSESNPIFAEAIRSLSGFNLGLTNSAENTLSKATFDAVWQQPHQPKTYRDTMQLIGSKLISDMAIIEALPPVAPAAAARYPTNKDVSGNGTGNTSLTTYGAQLRDLAHIIKQNIGLQVATVSIGGWDTHDNQGNGSPTGRQSKLLKEFALGLYAFYKDLEAAGKLNDVVVLTCTEFGRTVADNSNGGTDHAFASSWFAFGGSVRGGLYHKPSKIAGVTQSNTWTTLDPANLLSGRYVKPYHQFHTLYAEILDRHMGLTLAEVENVLPMWKDYVAANGQEPSRMFGTGNIT
jgi:uncharacterized protein (DUF1501 family)